MVSDTNQKWFYTYSNPDSICIHLHQIPKLLQIRYLVINWWGSVFESLKSLLRRCLGVSSPGIRMSRVLVHVPRKSKSTKRLSPADHGIVFGMKGHCLNSPMTARVKDLAFLILQHENHSTKPYQGIIFQIINSRFLSNNFTPKNVKHRWFS